MSSVPNEIPLSDSSSAHESQPYPLAANPPAELTNPLDQLQWFARQLVNVLWAEQAAAFAQHKKLQRARRESGTVVESRLTQFYKAAIKLGGRAGLGPSEIPGIVRPMILLLNELYEIKTVPRPEPGDWEKAYGGTPSDDEAAANNRLRFHGDAETYLAELITARLDPACVRLYELRENIEGRLSAMSGVAMHHPLSVWSPLPSTPILGNPEQGGQSISSNKAIESNPKGSGGRRRLSQAGVKKPEVKALHNAYEVVRGVLKQHPNLGRKGLLRHFKNYKDMRDLVRDAGKEFDEQFFHNAKEWIKANS